MPGGAHQAAALARTLSDQPALRFLAAQRSFSRRAGRAAPTSGNKAVVPTGGEPRHEVGEARHGWTPVRDPTTGGTYYWNKATNETTAVGEPMPGPGGRQVASGGGSALGSLGTLMGLGAGVAIAGTAVRMLLG